MPAVPFDVETLLQPLGEAASCGRDRAYDAEFMALEQSTAGKPERQYGGAVYAAEPPDWPAVHQQALALASSTRDLRVGVWLLRSATKLYGLRGAAAGLQLVAGLIERHWTAVHPQLDASDGNDPMMRLSALMPLAAPDAVPADLRGAPLGGARGSLTLRELELGLRKAEPAGDEAQPTEAGVLKALTDLKATEPDLPSIATSALQAGETIGAALGRHLGPTDATDLTQVLRLLRMLDAALRGQAATDAPNDAGPVPSAVAGPAGVSVARSGPAGSIQSRADAARELDRVCAWLEQHEPANPAPLLIRRAQRLMNKSFIEIIRDLAPDGVAQVETLAGPEAPT